MKRPAYYVSSSCGVVREDIWSCPFCCHTETNLTNYGKIGYRCPCGAVFIQSNDDCALMENAG